MNFVTKIMIAGAALAFLPVAAFAQANISTGANATTAVYPGSIMMVHPILANSAVMSVPSVAIGANGSVNVRGAKIESVSGSTIEAQSAWGATTIEWTVVTSASTKSIGSTTSALATGDSISFAGTLDTSAAFTVDAMMIGNGMGMIPPLPQPHPMMEGTHPMMSASGTVSASAAAFDQAPVAAPRPGFFSTVAARLGISF